MLGAGDLQLSLPPGSRTFPLEMSDGGHMILPIGEFDLLKEQNRTMTATPTRSLTLAAHPELIETPTTSSRPAPAAMVSQGTQTDDVAGGHDGRHVRQASSQ